MLKLQIKELFKLRGIKAPLAAMRKAGISQKVAQEYLSGKKKHLVLRHIEILCALLRCNSNDLFVWTPDNEKDDYPENPLQALRKGAEMDLHNIIAAMNLEEVKKRLS